MRQRCKDHLGQVSYCCTVLSEPRVGLGGITRGVTHTGLGRSGHGTSCSLGVMALLLWVRQMTVKPVWGYSMLGWLCWAEALPGRAVLLSLALSAWGAAVVSQPMAAVCPALGTGISCRGLLSYQSWSQGAGFECPFLAAACLGIMP